MYYFWWIYKSNSWEIHGGDDVTRSFIQRDQCVKSKFGAKKLGRSFTTGPAAASIHVFVRFWIKKVWIVSFCSERASPWPKFDKAVSELHDWLNTLSEMMKAEKIVLGDSDDMEGLVDKQKVTGYFLHGRYVPSYCVLRSVIQSLFLKLT